MTPKETKFSALVVLVYLISSSRSVFAQSIEIKQDTVISINKAPSLGENGAKVTMVEFGDYQCPLCAQHFNWTMRQLIDEYVKNGQVRYVFRDFPIDSIHTMASKAAEAAYCAGDQGKYWEMHDRFLRNQMSIQIDVLPLHATMLGLDIVKFQRCLDSGKHTADVRESSVEGKTAGVRGTPWFFLGLTDPNEAKLHALAYIEGAQPHAVFKEALDKLLSRALGSLLSLRPHGISLGIPSQKPRSYVGRGVTTVTQVKVFNNSGSLSFRAPTSNPKTVTPDQSASLTWAPSLASVE